MVKHQNNFDFIRFCAAFSVLISHQFALTGNVEPMVLRFQTLGGFGVLVFFAISGYLVAQSWDNDPEFFRFAARRALRIYPGLICAVLLVACVMGPMVTSLSLNEYFSHPAFRSYFSILWLVHQPFLPVFEHNPFAMVPNGVLWTIPLEIHWYAYLAALGIIGVLRRRWLFAALFAALVVWYLAIYHGEKMKMLGQDDLPEVKLGLFFAAGMAMHYFRDIWDSRRGRFFGSVAVVLLAAAAIAIHHELIAAFLLVPWFVVTIGTASTPVLRRFGRFGDLSYGVYIYAFPVQQTIVWASNNRLPVSMGIACAVPFVLAAAYVSWHCIEKPALKLKPRAPRSRGVNRAAVREPGRSTGN